jgi:hypothetical protein
MTAAELPLFVVCEDGHEYTERFQRFLGRDFRFLRIPGGGQVETAIESEHPVGLLLDLDFRRLPPADLLGQNGPPARAPSPEERASWSAAQGILILRYLRARGVDLPALLFADLDDREQAAYLEQNLRPLRVVSSREGLGQIAARLREMATRPSSATAGSE